MCFHFLPAVCLVRCRSFYFSVSSTRPGEQTVMRCDKPVASLSKSSVSAFASVAPPSHGRRRSGRLNPDAPAPVYASALANDEPIVDPGDGDLAMRVTPNASPREQKHLLPTQKGPATAATIQAHLDTSWFLPRNMVRGLDGSHDTVKIIKTIDSNSVALIIADPAYCINLADWDMMHGNVCSRMAQRSCACFETRRTLVELWFDDERLVVRAS